LQANHSVLYNNLSLSSHLNSYINTLMHTTPFPIFNLNKILMCVKS
jgi:hypothetical protein